jgi:putative acetyltransferase
MVHLVRTDSTDPAFTGLIQHLDRDLHGRYGAEQALFTPHNKLDKIRHVVVAYDGDTPVGCGAIRPFSDEAGGQIEVKRMYVDPTHRGQGIAATVLAELEGWAKELGYAKCVLETGNKQPEAIALYQKNGYTSIPNYGPYAVIESSVCFEKAL